MLLKLLNSTYVNTDQIRYITPENDRVRITFIDGTEKDIFPDYLQSGDKAEMRRLIDVAINNVFYQQSRAQLDAIEHNERFKK